MSAYVITSYSVIDPEKFAKYQELVGPTIAQFGGKMHVASNDFDVLAGSVNDLMVVIEFESKEVFNNWFTSKEYQAIKHYREEASAEGAWAVLAEGAAAPE